MKTREEILAKFAEWDELGREASRAGDYELAGGYENMLYVIVWLMEDDL